MKKLTLYAILIFTLIGCTPKNETRIVCIGDSITEGAGIFHQNKNSYPAILDSIMGDGFQVLNLGRGGSALQKQSDFSYWNTKEFSNVFSADPDIILIKHGTNDTKPQNWNSNRFEKDYQELIDTLRTLKSSPEIIMCLPVPVFQTHWGINDSTLDAGVIPVLRNIATKNKLMLIDLNSPFVNHPEYFPDNIHPDENGARQLARIIADFLKNNIQQ